MESARQARTGAARAWRQWPDAVRPVQAQQDARSAPAVLLCRGEARRPLAHVQRPAQQQAPLA